jgi:hypothetical protein
MHKAVSGLQIQVKFTHADADTEQKNVGWKIMEGEERSAAEVQHDLKLNHPTNRNQGHLELSLADISAIPKRQQKTDPAKKRPNRRQPG